MASDPSPTGVNQQITKFGSDLWPGGAQEAWIDGGRAYRVFHGTRSSYVEGIRANGLQAPGGTGPGWFMLTSRADVARDYAQGYADATHPGVVIEYHIPAGQVQDLLFPARTQHALGKSHALRFGQALPDAMIVAVHDASAITGPGWRAGDEPGVQDAGWAAPAPGQ
jgi:hypothetical protein